MIVQNIFGSSEELDVITLDPALEQMLVNANNQGAPGEPPVIEPGMVNQLQQSVIEAAQRQEVAGKPAVLLVGTTIRAFLARFVKASKGVIHVLAYDEIPDNKRITAVATIGGEA
jgi:flagellar biosynthesis protein FlhA